MVKPETWRNAKYGHFSIKVVQTAVITVFPTSYTCMLLKDYASVTYISHTDEFIVCCGIGIAL